jgi:S1-C subfamily serine protease
MPHDVQLIPRIRASLARAFSPREFADLTAAHLNFDSSGELPGVFGNMDDFFHNVVDALNRLDRLSDLIVAARAERPKNADLVEAAEALGLSATSRVLVGNTSSSGLEKAIRATPQHIDVRLFRERIGVAEARVCSIEVAGGALGTGLLIAGDRVLTNYHVAEPIRDGRFSQLNIKVRFDFKRDALGKPYLGTTVRLAADWLAAMRPYADFDTLPPEQPDPKPYELDYAVLVLERTIGDDSQRGWFALDAATAPPREGEPIFVLGHPTGEPQTLSMGKVLAHVGQGRRTRHDAWSLPGSSGSPALDANGQLFGLHHASEPGSGERARYNQAIPVQLIARDLARDAAIAV